MNEEQHAEFVQGDTQYFDVSVVDSDGSAVDLTGASIKYTLEHRHSSITKSVGNGITVTNATGGEFEIKLQSADTSSISGTGRHQVEITDSDGDVATVLGGVVRLIGGL